MPKKINELKIGARKGLKSMHTFRTIIFVLVCSILLVAFIMMSKLKDQSSLRVLFPIHILKSSAQIIDPSNTVTTGEYYLLENLAAGLIRDLKDSPSGYEGVYAESWVQTSPNTFTFKIRNQIKWSDGSPIALQEIADSLVALKNANSRHIVYLRKLSGVKTDDGSRTMTLNFESPVNSGVLHELSLADAGIMSQKKVDEGWKVTSGPYSVKAYDYPGEKLELQLNRNCPLARDYSPSAVTLFFPVNPNDVKEVFKKVPVDLYDISVFSFRHTLEDLIRNADEKIRAIPNVIYYFNFNPNFEHRIAEADRIAFASILQSAPMDLPPPLLRATQMIPVGYAGRLKEWAFESTKSKSFSHRGIKLLFPKEFKDSPEIFLRIKEAFKAANTEVEAVFTDGATLDSSVFAQIRIFKGNQRDSVGNWAFLFSPEKGPLTHFRPEVVDYFDKIVGAQTEMARERLIHDLHSKVLRHALAVPFAFEAPMVLHSRRVDLSHWNLFDLRARYYEVIVH